MGFLICIEGIDGAGKSTHARMLRDFFIRHGKDAIILKEPTQSEYGKEISRLAQSHSLDPQNELRLFILDRQIDVEENIKPALKSCKIVIMDRYFYSNMAYQAARGLVMNKIKDENEKFAPIPDLLIILDIDPKISMKRINKRNNIVDHFENEEYLKKVREKFLELGNLPNVKIIESNLSTEEVEANIEKAVIEKIPQAIKN